MKLCSAAMYSLITSAFHTTEYTQTSGVRSSPAGNCRKRRQEGHRPHSATTQESKQCSKECRGAVQQGMGATSRIVRACQSEVNGAQWDSMRACLGWRGVVLGGGRIAAVALRRPGGLLRGLRTPAAHLNRQLRRTSERVIRR